MDRRILVGLVLGVITSGGCSKSKAPDAAASSQHSVAARVRASRDRSGPRPAADAPATVAETHRPVIVSEAPIGNSASNSEPTQPPAAAPAPAPRFQYKTEMTFPDEVVEGNLEKPRSVDLTGNPLRRPGEEVERSAPAPTINPLRSSRAAAVPLAPESTPSGGGAPPESFAPSTPAAESIALGVAEGAATSQAEEFERVAREISARARAEAEAAAQAAMMRAKEAAGAMQKAAMPPAENSQYDVIQVFYGTDRQIAGAIADTWPARALNFGPAGICSLLTLCLAVVSLGRRSVALGLVSLLFAAVSAGLGYQAAAKTLVAVRHEGKEGVQYTTGRARGGNMDLGLCEVTIPKTHSIGELEAPSILRLEVREDASRHLVLRKTERLNDEPFYDLLRQRVELSPRKELFIFVHGFNVSFEEAARRTAQIHYDLRFEGAPVFFSWPAHDKFLLTYPADENNVEWSAPHLKQFLLNVAKHSQAKSINLIAHSMGNRALAAALREIELELRDQSRLFNQVILAAPDIDAEEFRTNIAPAMQRTAQRMTLYASARDDALLASQLLHRGPRAGDAGEGLVVVRGIDTIDVTAIDSSPWGHLYYGSSDPVLQDLKKLFTLAAAPPDRTWLAPAEREGLTYWIFQPARTAAGEGAITR